MATKAVDGAHTRSMPDQSRDAVPVEVAGRHEAGAAVEQCLQEAAARGAWHDLRRALLVRVGDEERGVEEDPDRAGGTGQLVREPVLLLVLLGEPAADELRVETHEPPALDVHREAVGAGDAPVAAVAVGIDDLAEVDTGRGLADVVVAGEEMVRRSEPAALLHREPEVGLVGGTVDGEIAGDDDVVGLDLGDPIGHPQPVGVEEAVPGAEMDVGQLHHGGGHDFRVWRAARASKCCCADGSLTIG